MQDFTKFITEGVSAGSIDKAIFLMKKYLQKKTGLKYFELGGMERYNTSKGTGFGIRMFTNKKNYSVRLNFTSQKASTNALKSFDVWLGVKGKGPIHVEFDQFTSVIKILPAIANIINRYYY